MEASSALVIRTLTSGADLMKSSASRPSLKALTTWPSSSSSRDTAFRIVRLGSTTTMRTIALPAKGEAYRQSDNSGFTPMGESAAATPPRRASAGHFCKESPASRLRMLVNRPFSVLIKNMAALEHTSRLPHRHSFYSKAQAVVSKYLLARPGSELERQ